MNSKRSRSRFYATKLLLSVFFIVCVLYPFVRMMFQIKPSDFGTITSAPMFGTAVKNSLISALSTMVISISLALALAFCVQRTRIKCKGLLQILLIIPMLIPSVAHGMGLRIVFGQNGIITNLLGVESNIYGFAGIIIASVLYSYPVAFLMFNDVLKYEDASPYEAARVLGIPKIRQFTAITLPYLLKPIISAAFAVFTLVITDYGIPFMIGGQTDTLSLIMYNKVLGSYDFGGGGVIGLFLLIPAVITFIYNTVSKANAKSGFVTKPFELKKNKLRDVLSGVFCGLVVAFVVLLIGSFLVMGFMKNYPYDTSFTLDHVRTLFDMRGGTYLKNSIIISIAVALVGVIVAFTTAYMTTRLPSKMSSFLHLLSITSLAIPGIVLGLSYAMTFSGSFIYGTLAIIIMANLMHFFASPYLMMYNSLGKLNPNLEGVGKTLGIGRLRMIFSVIIPQSRSTMFEMFSYFFVNSMMTISAVSFLSSSKNKPLSLMINQFRESGKLSCAAIVALLILAINLMIKGIVYIINHSKNRSTSSAR